MLEPSIDDLQKQIRSKYTLATLAAKRARQLGEEQETLLDSPKSDKNISLALEEIEAGKLYVAGEKA